MLLSIDHATHYRFADGVAHGLQRLRLKPKSTHGQHVRDWHMEFSGAQIEAEYDDHNNNHTTLISIHPGQKEVVVSCRGNVETTDNSGIIGAHAGHMALWGFLRPTPLTRAGLKVRSLLASVEADKSDPLAFLHALSSVVRDAVEYKQGHTDAATTAEQSLAAGIGVCQDHAHVFISAGRLADIPMRYVAGYLLMDDRTEQDAGHGWAEAHVAGLGWVGFDVSNAICPDERYVRVATGCDYSEAAPVTGVAVGAGETQLDVRLSVGEKLVGQQQQQSLDGQRQCQSKS